MAIPAAELKAMLKRDRLTYDDLGKRLGRSARLVQKWVTDGEVPPDYAAAVRAALHHEDESPLSGFTNYELLAEISRRLEGGSGHIFHTGNEGPDESGSVRPSDTASPDPEGQHKSGPRRIRGRGPRIT